MQTIIPKITFFRLSKIALLILLVLLLIYRLFSLYGELPESAPADPQAKVLFDRLRDNALLVQNDEGIIALPLKDTALAMKANNTNDKEMLKTVENLIDDLYYSAPGKRVQQQIDAWNQTRKLVAIRDNSRGNNPALSWQAYDKLGHAVLTSKNSQVPLEFGFINQGKLPQYFGAWLSIGKKDKKLVFKKIFELKKRQKIRIDIIGTPDVSYLSNFTARVKKYVDKNQINCTGKSAVAHAITLTLPKGRHELSIPVTPTHNPVTMIEGMAISYDRKKSDNPKCYRFLTGNQLTWDNDKMNAEKSKRLIGLKNSAKINIQTADGVPLVAYQPALEATEKTLELGLLPLIGQDEYDYYSLTGMSRGLQEDTTIITTIDSRLQRAALDILKKKYGTNGTNASLVIVDVKSGDILSAAAVPLAKNHISLWDRNSFSKTYPKRDPYAFIPWQGLGKHNAPGSVFKLVTAIALLRASEDNSTIKRAINGMSANQLSRLGIYTNGRAWVSRFNGHNGSTVPEVYNYGKSAMHPIHFSPQCGDKVRDGDHNWSLLDMIGKSYNTWFTGLTEIADYEALTGERDSILVQTAKDFGYDAIFSLNPEEVPFKRILPEKTKIGVYATRGDALNAFGGQMDYSIKMKGVPATQLSRLSFGQASATTPLTMALVSASIARGEFVRPKLFVKVNDNLVSQPDFKPLRVNRSGLDFLRLAMKGVVQKNGTAREAFKHYRNNKEALGCRVHAKTGTSDADDKTKSAWMTGYLTDKDKEPSIAFACMVQKAASGGGTECGPLLRDMLLQYEQIMKEQ